MKYISCPHCGKNVSDSANTCLHCGGNVREKPTRNSEQKSSGDLTCPQCGTPYEAGQTFCGACGCVLSQAARQKQEESARKKQEEEDAKKIEEKIDKETKYWFLVGRSGAMIELLGFLLIGVAVILFILWKDQSYLECLASMQSRMELCKMLIWFGAIIIAGGSLFRGLFAQLIYTVTLSRFIQNSKFDYREYIRKYGNDKDRTKKFCTDTLTQVALILESKKEKSWFILKFIITHVLQFASAISLSIFFCTLFSHLFSTQILSAEIQSLLDLTGIDMSVIDAKMSELALKLDELDKFIWKKTEFIVAIGFVIAEIAWTLGSLVNVKRIKNKKQEILLSAKN